MRLFFLVAPIFGLLLHATVSSALGQEETTRGITAQVEAVFAQPRFSHQSAWMIEDEDLLGNSVTRTESFQHDFAAAPRLTLEYQSPENIGLRSSWWLLTSEAGTLRGNPPVSGFGEIRHPELYGINLCSVVPAETLSAENEFDLYAIDLEVTKNWDLGPWSLLTSAGLRHAAIDQTTRYQLRNGLGDLAGTAELTQSLAGIGPTLSFTSQRTAWERLQMAATLRASILLSQSKIGLHGAEDLDLPTPFTTEYTENANDLLPILETRWQVGWNIWQGNRFDWTSHVGVEAQWWSGVGSASDPQADLAILGLFVGTGFHW